MEDKLLELKNTFDTAWVVIMSLLVFFMNSGFAMLETGLCRAKNAVNMLSKNLVVFFVATLAFWSIGFAIMFSGLDSILGSTGETNSLFLLGNKEIYSSLDGVLLPLSAIFFFQMVFACTTPTVVSGGVAERVKFLSFLAFTFFLTALVYPVIGHWIIGKGCLYQMGVRDFAGSLTVHTVGGISALSGVILLGPRVGKYNKDLSPNVILGHSIPMVTLGGFILWLGWFGFNLGCVFGFSSELSSHIVLCTNASGIMGGLSALILSYLIHKKADLSIIINGLLGGLVASTASCAYVNLTSAYIIGFVTGIIITVSVLLMDRVFHIDDPVGAISVHGIGGIWGAISVGLFALPQQFEHPHVAFPQPGLFFGGGVEQLLLQLIGVAYVVSWAFIGSFLIWIALKYTIGIRVSQKAEVDGLDIAEHGIEAYPGFVKEGDGII